MTDGNEIRQVLKEIIAQAAPQNHHGKTLVSPAAQKLLALWNGSEQNHEMLRVVIKDHLDVISNSLSLAMIATDSSNLLRLVNSFKLLTGLCLLTADSDLEEFASIRSQTTFAKLRGRFVSVC